MTIGMRILDYIGENPGITAGEISDALGLIPSHVYNECGALENTGRIAVDRGGRPYRYYPANAFSPISAIRNPLPACKDASPYVEEFSHIIRSVTEVLGRKIDSGYEVIDRGVPHIPHMLKSGTMGIYTFLYEDAFLKIGKAGPRSNARFFSQHYNPGSAASTLAKSILTDERLQGLGITEANVGDWIRQNTRRIDILLDEKLGIFTLSLVEAALHYRYEPRYEGFRTQR